MDMKQFDGFYFLPGEEEDEIRFQFFNLTDESLKGKPVNNNTIGDMYHIAFFKQNEKGQPEFDDEFEAIFADPLVYIEHNIVGMDLYGCVFRKTENSHKWWQDYIDRAKEHCKVFQKGQPLTANT